MMTITTNQALQYEQMKEEVLRYAQSYRGAQYVTAMSPQQNLRAAKNVMEETEEAAALLKSGASVPLPAMEGMEQILQLLGTGYILQEGDWMQLQQFLRSVKQLLRYMETKRGIAPVISSYAASMSELPGLLMEIERCIYAGRIQDHASKELSKIRKKLLLTEDKLKRKLSSLLLKHRELLQESLVSQRNGKYVIPVKKEHRRLIPGVVMDESASGQTVYIEPADAAALSGELSLLQADEAREENIILSLLTAKAEAHLTELAHNAEAVGQYDYILARGKYGLSIGGQPVKLNDEGVISLRQVRHPLLHNSMIPLDVEMGGTCRALIITGPNTGGKTMTLKTVGLVTLMAQSGLFIPADEGSMCSIFREIFVDIGDGQSLEHALSTFSAHLAQMKRILDSADHRSLILLDEMASGTDPGEGIGLSIAILEELHRRRCIIMATTHFNELKHFAANTHGFQNARMEFDLHTLAPTYRLRIGEAGESYALIIAARLGISKDIITRSLELRSSHQVHPIGTPSSEDGREEEIVEAESDAEPPSSSEEPQEDAPALKVQESRSPFQVGDAVWISYLNAIGIVYAVEDKRGRVGVQVRDSKLRINHKRLKLHIEAAELYPEQYDMSIVFDSKENRKKRRLLQRKHVEGLSIEMKPDEG
ncbi:DNA mismatch repair protein MutS [Paenibacillus sp. JSM ZJ436]|uniref:endonuclease MutS2 n=2 Tax=unclassified Paenibacillus TaxID=185978 RepID=UPI0037B4AF16